MRQPIEGKAVGEKEKKEEEEEKEEERRKKEEEGGEGGEGGRSTGKEEAGGGRGRCALWNVLIFGLVYDRSPQKHHKQRGWMREEGVSFRRVGGPR